jgi:hypothetical protein
MCQAQWKTWLERYLCLTKHSQGLEKPYSIKKMKAAAAGNYLTSTPIQNKKSIILSR